MAKEVHAKSVIDDFELKLLVSPNNIKSTTQKKEEKTCFKWFLRKAKIFATILLITVVITTFILFTFGLSQWKKFVNFTGQSNPLNMKMNTITLGKIDRNDAQICQGNELKKSFPDLDYATYGYNIINGYPLAAGHDPGLTHPIFKADYTDSFHTADCRYHVPKGYHLVPDVACITSFTSETIKDSRQFSKALSVSAQVSGGGWGVSFSASTEYQKKSSEMSASESVFIHSTAKCNYYFAMLNEKEPPHLTNAFLDTARNIRNARDALEMFNYYGTHYLTYTLFGARFVYEHKMSKENFQSESSESVSVSVKASYSGSFSLSGGFGMSSAQSQKASRFLSKVETKTISIGAPPPSSGNAMTWASTVKETPVPIQYKMKDISDLFSPLFMENTGIDFNKTRKLLKEAKEKYCKDLLHAGKVESCDVQPEYLGFNGIGIWHTWTVTSKFFSYTREKCKERCLNENRCVLIYHHDSIGCHLINGQAIGGKVTLLKPLQIEHAPQSVLLVLPDTMRLLGVSLSLKNAKVKESIKARRRLSAKDHQACYDECRKDNFCSTYTFHRKDNATQSKNCFTYSLKQLSCRKENICNPLVYEDGYSTMVSVV